MPTSVDSDSRPAALEAVAAQVARDAAVIVAQSAGFARAAGTKSTPTDVVTETDLRVETAIREQLAERCPGSAVLGEEFGQSEGANNVGWIVDPIDGTVNFLYDLPVTSVSIAATIDGIVVAGAVADVHRGDLYSAADREGARCNGEPISPSGLDRLSDGLVGTGFAYDAERRAAQAEVLLQLLPACRDIRCMGSAALNLCWVAHGRLDAFYERDLKPYDFAAGALIARESGAKTAVFEDQSDLVLAATPGVFDQVRRLL